MTNYFLPIFILLIICLSYKNCNIYDSFILGCKNGINTFITLFPSMMAIIFATNVLISSNILNLVINMLKPLLNSFNYISELIPIIILKPISGSAVMSFLINIYEKYGVDSKISLIASVIYSNTDTSIYILSLYTGLLSIKKTKYAYPLCIFINLISIIVSIVVVNLLY